MLPKLYLYLTEVAWLDPWVNGGPVPLNVASAYLSRDRSGTMTPDETHIVQTTGNITNNLVNSDYALLGFDNAVEVSNFRLNDVYVTGFGEPAESISGTYSRRTEDGAILCFSRAPNAHWIRSGKKACVLIKRADMLLRHLDDTLGAKGISSAVRYTDTAKRGHFSQA